MLALSPKAIRIVDLAVKRLEIASYQDAWLKEHHDEAELSPVAARIALVALAALGAYIEIELEKSDLQRERRIIFNNDLWFVSDLMTEILEELTAETVN
jgi:hypothetical protein